MSGSWFDVYKIEDVDSISKCKKKFYNTIDKSYFSEYNQSKKEQRRSSQ